jgi:hypothetical protein
MPQGRSGRVQKFSPPTGIRSPESPARSESLYRRSYPGPNIHIYIHTHTHTHTRIYIYMYIYTHTHTHTHTYIHTYIHKLTNDVNFLPLCLEHYKLVGNCCLVTLLSDLLECTAKFVALNVCRNMLQYTLKF